MSFSFAETSIPSVIAGLLGAIDVDGGPTDDQLRVLGAISAHLFHVPADGFDATARLSADELSEALTDEVERRRFHEILVTLECCRHPLGDNQVKAVEEYASALGVESPDLQLFRSFIDNSRQQAAEDFDRFFTDVLPLRSEPSLPGVAPADERDEDLAGRLRALGDLEPGTLGHEFVEFYRRAGIPLPGSTASSLNHFYVAHDMTHVIAGIEPTGPGEIALSAFQMTMNDNAVNRAALLSSLIFHEAGFGNVATRAGEASILERDGAAELLGEEMERGAACTGDFSLVDHFALAPLPLEEVRRRFGVPAPKRPDDGHHFWSGTD